MARRADGEDLLDALFAAPPQAFVAARARAVAELRSAGRTAEAREVARLRRPTVPAWAVNQLARRAPDEIAALLALGARLRAAERQLLKGRGGGGELMADARLERQRVGTLARRAEQLAADAGRKPTATLTRKIAQTLHAAALGDEQTRAALASGRLTHELTPPSGFGTTSRAGAEAAVTTAPPIAAPAGRKPRAEARPSRIPSRPAARTPAAALERPAAEGKRATGGERQQTAAERKRAAIIERKRAAAERKRAAIAEHKRAAAERKRAAAERKHAARAARARHRVEAAARKRLAQLRRRAQAADHAVARHQRAVERARQAVEAAERALRAAKDALAAAVTRAAAAHRAVEESY